MNQKYDLRAIPYIGKYEPFLVQTSNNIILRRDELGNFILLDSTQETMLSLTKQDAKELAISILNSSLFNIQSSLAWALEINEWEKKYDIKYEDYLRKYL